MYVLHGMGECPNHGVAVTPDGEPDLNYLCAGYKAFFHHVDLYMLFMAAELAAGRPPANVMRWVERAGAANAPARAVRNHPCPCGIGKKFKVCCGVKS
jgi:uncharacterized protein